MTYNVPVIGNISVEADSEQQAIAIVENGFRQGPTRMAVNILNSLEIDTTGVSEL